MLTVSVGVKVILRPMPLSVLATMSDTIVPGLPNQAPTSNEICNRPNDSKKPDAYHELSLSQANTLAACIAHLGTHGTADLEVEGDGDRVTERQTFHHKLAAGCEGGQRAVAGGALVKVGQS